MKGKKADVSMPGTIAAVIIIAILLGFLVYWWITGTNPFGDIVGNIWGKSNIGLMASTICPVACTSKPDYCDRIRDVKFQDAQEKIRTVKLSCYALANGPRTVKDTKGVDVTLPDFEVNCGATGVVCSSKYNCVDGLKGTWVDKVAPATTAVCPVNTDDKTADVTDSTDTANVGKKCCVAKPAA